MLNKVGLIIFSLAANDEKRLKIQQDIHNPEKFTIPKLFPKFIFPTDNQFNVKEFLYVAN